MKTKYLLRIGIVICGLFFCGLPAFAVENSESTAYDYTVTPEFGSTQKKETTSFFDLVMKPDEHDQFKLKVVNTADNEQKFKIDVTTATTNSNGIVDYTQLAIKRDPSMELEVSKLIHANFKQLVIPAHQAKEVQFEVAMPNRAFTGILLGGIVIVPETKTTDKGIQNVFMHTLAVRVAETNTTISPELKGGKVTLGQENLHNTVSMVIRNPKPKLMTQMTGDFYITEKGSDKRIAEEKKQNLSIAPNSQFKLPILVKDNFKTGNYVYTINLSSNEGSWKFQKEFTIKPDQANKYNQQSVDKEKGKNQGLLISLVVVIVILLLIILYLAKRKKKK